MCNDNSPLSLCGVPIKKYAEGGEYGMQRGLRFCTEVKAFCLYAAVSGYNQNDKNHLQILLENCNLDHGREYLAVIHRRLGKTMDYYMKYVAEKKLNETIISSHDDAIKWLENHPRQKTEADGDVKMTDIASEIGKTASYKSESKAGKNTSHRIDKSSRYSPKTSPRKPRSGRPNSPSVASSQLAKKNTEADALDQAWDVLYSKAEEDAGGARDAEFETLLHLDRAVKELQTRVDMKRRKMAFNL